jgi:hypothetical protein
MFWRSLDDLTLSIRRFCLQDDHAGGAPLDDGDSDDRQWQKQPACSTRSDHDSPPPPVPKRTSSKMGHYHQVAIAKHYFTGLI